MPRTRGMINRDDELSVTASGPAPPKNDSDYIPRAMQVAYPQLWVLNDALHKIYKDNKVPEHIRAPVLLRHFFTFNALSEDRDVLTVMHFTSYLENIYKLRLSHETWLAVAEQTIATHKPFLKYVTPVYILAALCAFGGTVPPPCGEYWPFYEWMLQEDSQWPDIMPAFWKGSNLTNHSWIEKYFGSESQFKVRVPKEIRMHHVDTWLGPKRDWRDHENWRGSDYGKPEYHKEWRSIMEDPHSPIQAPEWIKSHISLSEPDEAARVSFGGTDESERDDPDPELTEDGDNNETKLPAQSPAPVDGAATNQTTPTPEDAPHTAAVEDEALEEALQRALEQKSWQEATELARRKLAKIKISYKQSPPNNAGAIQHTHNELFELTLIMKAGTDALKEERDEKERAMASLVAERIRINQSIETSTHCQAEIAQIMSEMTDRGAQDLRRKRPRLEE